MPRKPDYDMTWRGKNRDWLSVEKEENGGDEGGAEQKFNPFLSGLGLEGNVFSHGNHIYFFAGVSKVSFVVPDLLR
jgi:hypothetical protein